MKKAILTVVVFALPSIAFAQTLQPIVTLVSGVGTVVNMLIPILIAVALVVFFWGLIKYIRSSGEGHAEGRNIMIAGILSLFVMVSVWGIIHLAQGVLNLNNNNISAPCVAGTSGCTNFGPASPVPYLNTPQ